MTPKQQKCLDFIRSYTVQNGLAPSIREIQTALGCKSSGQISDVLVRMEADKLIRRTSGKARSIKIIALNDNPDPWVQIGKAALRVLDSIKSEDIDDETGEGTVTVDAAALGDLDAAIAEAMETHHG